MFIVKVDGEAGAGYEKLVPKIYVYTYIHISFDFDLSDFV